MPDFGQGVRNLLCPISVRVSATYTKRAGDILPGLSHFGMISIYFCSLCGPASLSMRNALAM